MIQPLTLEEFLNQAETSERVAVFDAIAAGQLTPIDIYRLLKKIFAQEGVILEDLQPQAAQRYSFICFEPLVSLALQNNDATNPLVALRESQLKFNFSARADIAELITHAVGFITYDFIRSFEEIPDRHAADATLPALLFHFYRFTITLDHDHQLILISTIVDVDQDSTQAYHIAKQKIKNIIEVLQVGSAEDDEETTEKNTPSTIDVDISDHDFMRMVEKAKEYIIRGDAFQIVLSRCFKRHYSVAPLVIYQALRRKSPSPFMFYFPTETCVLIGASPERLIRVHNGQITVNPIAGTRKRQTAAEDDAIASDLLSDKKELAEHMMLVDLARNDVGAVSQPGSVRVDELLKVKHYSHVSHITSTVTGQLQNKFDAFDALTAAFPAGTLSGAPKIRAMNIIDELETSRRGLYGGAICRLDSLNNLESCIAIRAAVLKDGIATVRTGAGIVYDSTPNAEANETRAKAAALLDAIADAHRGDTCC